MRKPIVLAEYQCGLSSEQLLQLRKIISDPLKQTIRSASGYLVVNGRDDHLQTADGT